MNYIKHYPVNDLAYKLMFQEGMKALASNSLNFENPNVLEIIEIFNINLFFNDEKLLTSYGIDILNSNRKYLSQLRKAQNLYFKDIGNSKIENDFIYLKKCKSDGNLYSSSDYFKALSSNIDFAKCQSNIAETCLKYVPVWSLVRNKKFVNTFASLIKNYMLSHPESFRLLVDKYDDASLKCNYHFPRFSDGEINSLIEGYLSSNKCDFRVLELVVLHKDSSDTYRIRRKTRLKIMKKLEQQRNDFFSDENTISIPFNFSLGLIASPSQEELIREEKHDGEKIISFSKAFFKDATTWDQVFKKLLDFDVLINQLDSVSGIYNPFKENTISKIFETVHANQYGSQTYQVQNDLYQVFFNFFYTSFARENKRFEDLAIWLIDEKINPLMNGSKLCLTFTKDNNPRIKCENVFNEISSLLLQYRIFVEKEK